MFLGKNITDIKFRVSLVRERNPRHYEPFVYKEYWGSVKNYHNTSNLVYVYNNVTVENRDRLIYLYIANCTHISEEQRLVGMYLVKEKRGQLIAAEKAFN